MKIIMIEYKIGGIYAEKLMYVILNGWNIA